MLERWVGVTGVDDREDRREEEFLLGRTPVARRRDDAKESKKKTTNHLCQGYGGQEYTKGHESGGDDGKAVGRDGTYLRTFRQDLEARRKDAGIGRSEWADALGPVDGDGEPTVVVWGFEDVDGLTVDRIRVGTGEGGMVPTLVISRGETDRVTVALSAKGKGHIVVRGGRRRR